MNLALKDTLDARSCVLGASLSLLPTLYLPARLAMVPRPMNNVNRGGEGEGRWPPDDRLL